MCFCFSLIVLLISRYVSVVSYSFHDYVTDLKILSLGYRILLWLKNHALFFSISTSSIGVIVLLWALVHVVELFQSTPFVQIILMFCPMLNLISRITGCHWLIKLINLGLAFCSSYHSKDMF